MSYWKLYVEDSGGAFPAQETLLLPRPNDDLNVGKTSNQTANPLADGSIGYYTPETKSIKNDLTFTWVMRDEDFLETLESYIDNHDFIKIETHTSREFIGRFLNVNGKWLTGEDEEFEITATFARMEGSD